MLKTLYLSLYFVPLLAFAAVVIPKTVVQYQADLQCAHELSRHPLTSTCTF